MQEYPLKQQLVETLVAEANQRFDRYNFDGAVVCFEAALKLDPNNISILADQGKALVKLRRYSEALKIYQKAIKIDPNNLRAHNGIAFCLHRLEKYSLAEAYFFHILQRDPDFLPTILTQAEFLKDQKNYEKSLVKYKHALSLKPQSIRILIGIAQVCYQLNDRSNALKYFKMVLDIDPSHIFAKKKCAEINGLMNPAGDKEIKITGRKVELKIPEKSIESTEIKKETPIDSSQYEGEKLPLERKDKIKKEFQLPGEDVYELAHEQLLQLQYKKALPFLHKAADKGYPLAYVGLQKIYSLGGPGGATCEPQLGLVWAKRLVKEIAWLEAQSDCGNDRASEALGYLRSAGVALRRDYQIAEIWFGRAIQQNPYNIAALINRCTPRAALGRLKESLDDIDQALYINPKHVIALVNKANLLSLLKKSDEAIKYIDEALSVDHTFTYAFYIRGGIFSRKNLSEAAIKSYQEALKVDPKFLPAIVECAELLFFNVGKKDEAMRNIVGALEIDKNFVPAVTTYARMLDNMNLKDEALIYYNRALEREPENIGALFNRTIFLNRMGLKKEAKESANQFEFSAQVKNFDHINKWALIQLYFGNAAEALNIINAILSVDSECVMALNTKGLILQALGSPVEALKNYQIVLSAEPANVSALTFASSALRDLDESKISLDLIQSTLAINPGNTHALMQQSVIFHELDDTLEALKSIKKLLDVEPKNIGALIFQCRMYQKLKDFKNALDVIKIILSYDPKNITAINQRGIIMLHMNDFQGALENFEMILTINPEDADALGNKGLMFLLKKEYDQALNYYNKSLQKNPGRLLAEKNRIKCLIALNRVEEALDCMQDVLSNNSKDKFDIKQKTEVVIEMSELSVPVKLKRLSEYKSKTTVMSFTGNSFSSQNFRVLIKEIENHPSLLQLLLDVCQLTDENLISLERAIFKNKNLINLSYEHNSKLTNRSNHAKLKISAYLYRNLMLLQEHISDTDLHELDLENLILEDIRQILTKHAYLETIDFSRKNLTCNIPILNPTCIPRLSGLTYLNLSHNRLGGESKNASRTDVIDLDKGIQNLGILLKGHYHLFPKLKKLSLANNRIGKEGFQYLAEAMSPNIPLEILELHSNFIELTGKKLSEYLILFRNNKNLSMVNLWGNSLLSTCDELLMEMPEKPESIVEEDKAPKDKEKKYLPPKMAPLIMSTTSIFYAQKPLPNEMKLDSVLDPNYIVDKDNCLIVLACPKGYIWEQHALILLEIMRPAKSQRSIYKYDFVTNSFLWGEGQVRKKSWEVALAARTFQDKYFIDSHPMPRVSGEILKDNVEQQIEEQKRESLGYALSSGSLKKAMNCLEWCKIELGRVGIQVSGILPRSAVQKKSGIFSTFRK